MKALLLFIPLVSFSVIAETENFNMALSGTFEKDYCYIYNWNSYTEDIDLTAELTTHVHPLNGKEFVRVGRRTLQIQCQVDVNVTYSVPEDFQIHLEGIMYAAASYDSGVEFIGTTPTPGISLRYSSVTGGYSGYGSMGLYAAPNSDDWNDLPDTFATTMPVIITLEPK